MRQRLSVIAIIAAAAAACGVHVKSFDLESGLSEVKIDKDAAISAVCLESNTGQWKCLGVIALRQAIPRESRYAAWGKRGSTAPKRHCNDRPQLNN